MCMVTGDGKETALAIASMLGLDQEGKISLSGAEVERMGERELQVSVDPLNISVRLFDLVKLRFSFRMLLNVLVATIEQIQPIN